MQSLDSQRKVFFWRTSDGSPTASLGLQGERMHHRGGALAETLHVYAPAIEWASRHSPRPHFFSFGLGLGYVEWVLFAMGVRHRFPFRCRSFESDPWLREGWQIWLSGGPALPGLEDAVSCVARHFGIASAALIQCGRDAFSEGFWTISERYEPGGRRFEFCHAVLYDLFSPKSDPEPWSAPVLGSLLREQTDPSCVFATYASTGSLKRLLKGNGFSLRSRKGFGGKRECTFAVRSISVCPGEVF